MRLGQILVVFESNNKARMLPQLSPANSISVIDRHSPFTDEEVETKLTAAVRLWPGRWAAATNFPGHLLPEVGPFAGAYCTKACPGHGMWRD